MDDALEKGIPVVVPLHVLEKASLEPESLRLLKWGVVVRVSTAKSSPFTMDAKESIEKDIFCSPKLSS